MIESHCLKGGDQALLRAGNKLDLNESVPLCMRNGDGMSEDAAPVAAVLTAAAAASATLVRLLHADHALAAVTACL